MPQKAIPERIPARNSSPLDDVFLTVEQVCALLGKSREALSQDRYRRVGPSFIKAGKKVLYRRDDVEAWLNAGRVDTFGRRSRVSA